MNTVSKLFLSIIRNVIFKFIGFIYHISGLAGILFLILIIEIPLTALYVWDTPDEYRTNTDDISVTDCKVLQMEYTENADETLEAKCTLELVLQNNGSRSTTVTNIISGENTVYEVIMYLPEYYEDLEMERGVVLPAGSEARVQVTGSFIVDSRNESARFLIGNYYLQNAAFTVPLK